MLAPPAGLALVGSLAGCTGGPDYGVFGPEVEADESAVAADPCDPVALLRLVDVLKRAGHRDEAMDRLQGRPDRCRRAPEVLEKTLDLAEELGRWSAALPLLDEKVAASPHVAGLYVRRAAAREGAGDAPGAADDRRRAFLVDPRDEEAAVAYARSLGERQGDCEAWEAWALVGRIHPPRAAEGRLKRAALDPGGACRHVSGEAHGVVETLTSQGVFALPGTLGDAQVRVATDTAMPVTLVAPRVADALHLATGDRPVFARSAFGTSAGVPTELPPLTIGGITIEGLHGLVGDTQLRDVDVVLGLDAMVRIDLVRSPQGRWDLTPSP